MKKLDTPLFFLKGLMNRMFEIRVPATSANLGPGFDSLGLAVSLYLTLTVKEEAEEWEILHDLGEGIPTDKSNLIIETALSLAPKMKPRNITMVSEIPAARGLGSSSAAIVAGIELANQCADLHLSIDEKIQIATRIEGHPDNVTPAITGDFTVGTVLDSKVFWMKASFPETVLVVTIPDKELLTKESRAVLPDSLPFKDAVKGSGIANMLVAAVLSGDIEQAGKLMEQDVFHEPFRGVLVPELALVRKLGHEMDAYGTYLSGAGTTILTMIHPDKAAPFVAAAKAGFPGSEVKMLQIEKTGVQVIR